MPRSKVPLRDQSGAFIADIVLSEAHRLIRDGHAIAHGTKTRIHILRLTVPLALANGEVAQQEGDCRALSIQNYTGTKYTKREHVAGCFYIHQHKRLAKGAEPLFDTVFGGCIRGLHDPPHGSLLCRGFVERQPIELKQSDGSFEVAA